MVLAPVLSGCIGPGGFLGQIENFTDRRWTVAISLVASENGTEAYNRTFDVGPDEIVQLPGFPPWIGNFTVTGRLDDGRTDRRGLDSDRFCPSCTLSFFIEEDEVRWVVSVVD